jgi:8-oxo-dGTP pyrophosphatase MutT (NUDIX family)
VVVRRTGDGVEVALAARRTRKGDLAWGLPKGLVEPGEKPEEAAVREVREETGLQAEILQPLGDISYWYVWEGERIRKRVTFFLMEAVGGDVSQHDHEMEDVLWFPLEEARRKASYSSERGVLRRAAEALPRSA